MSNLEFAVKHAERVGVTRDLPYGDEDLRRVANSATLIYGDDEALLVDSFTTREQNDELVEWVRSFGKRLTRIYITHGHGDHLFGLNQLLAAFPDAEAVATPETIDTARHQGSDEYMASFWDALFPGQIARPIVFPTPLTGDRLDVEGHEIRVIPTGHTDTEFTTAVWVPELRLLVAGDAVYDETHTYLAETSAESREAWAATLDRLSALRPAAIVAGHGWPGRTVGPDAIDATATYLRDFNVEAARAATAEDLFDAMMRKYGDRRNPGSLWGGAKRAMS
ncbi:MBL fold metallo-hydrolase [Curtobacterium flaccumfaciens pv. flaccumfaciens]|uniref:MBL fold metallo-hydrolase n=1 Tax=Curtobacterium TaxID=2034 RepID=UPI000DA95D4B|nr:MULTISPECIES: MBL fold metallo-hydrolase [Curtobacterium]MBO9046086.1 MBL fold metallo-hydrolase [Curtobacterium flaccumfaciens pv. flaccumfaciens]MCS5495433.1 MBL fold metallo-hydrolase [Curtobacterium flaccumfaciens pv. flaccumfaciens]PZF44636.1 MBL fold metallo-hydrolase [Curtobacterium sp. MCLR17_053]PZF52717.1 MBL fold metallo-hydrolase [Curtobacterium sp. MCLR17_051]QTR90759.1 MBL fold metallo-hydrolase [Curtobacterium flaccumfaciens pv. flaccumfaciens]